MAKGSMMPKWLKLLLTESDNYTYDIVRILAVFSVVEFLSLQIYVTITSHAFDGVGFGAGIGGVLVATGAALKLKPESKDDNAT